MFDLTVDLRHLDTFSAKVAGFDARLRKALVTAVTRATLAVEKRAKELVSGPVLTVRTGTLRRSISHRIEPQPDRVTGRVTAGAAYARIHELGGTTRPHLIRPKRAKALRFGVQNTRFLESAEGSFSYDGVDMVFARVVHHPGSKIPERSYLRRALRETTGQIRAEIRLAVREAAAFGRGTETV